MTDAMPTEAPGATTPEEPNAAALSPVKRALLEVRELRARLAAAEARASEPIAIVGMSIRAPGGVTDVDGFAQLLWSGTDAITEIPDSRWPVAQWYDEGQDTAGKMYTTSGGFIDDVDQFDAEFFGIAPVEAASMDPQQRLVLELAWHALEHAGHSPGALAGSSAGVYLGMSNSDYGRALLSRPELIDPYFSQGVAFSVAAGRIAYVLGLQGPAITIDTACSSSLVSLHLACQGLRNGDCDLALAGGVNLILSPEIHVNFSRAGMLSRDGRCHTFDAEAGGYVRGEGGGMVVLRRLRDALADGDRVLAVVRGSAVNQDGRSNGLTAPHGPSQESVIRAALARAGVAPADVGYVETHGTGTSLGDPIEVNALAAALHGGRDASTPLRLGALKTNIGHLEAAAGIAGIIKTVLVLQRGEVPPNLHFRTPNPLIDWGSTPLEVPTVVTPWLAREGTRRTAGVSSFGFSGTNAHVILEEAPIAALPDPATPESTGPELVQVLVLSAKDDAALRVLADRYRLRLNTHDAAVDGSLGDFCVTASVGRAHLAHRLSVSGTSAATLAAGLDAWLRHEPHPRVVAGVATSTPRVAYLFPGQGPQYVGMGRALYNAYPAYRRAFDACADALDPLLPQPIRSIVLSPDGDASLLHETTYAQPAMFAIEYALAALWTSWGIEPSAVIGHSFGEYAAACVAGVVSLPDAALMIAARGRLVASLDVDGCMTVVEASEAELLDAIREQGGVVAIAAINGPANCVISGETAAVGAIAGRFAAMGRRVKALHVSQAFHSPLIDPVLDAFERELAAVPHAPSTTTLVSTLTGEVATVATFGRARYWRDHLREPVRFAQAVHTLSAQRISHYVELSPQPVLLGMAADCVAGGAWLPSMRESDGALDEMLLSLQRLYVDGAAIDWAAVAGEGPHRRVSLPLYPFQRKRHWIDVAGTTPTAHNSLPDFWSHAAPALDAQADRGPLDLDAATYPATWEFLARLTNACVLQTLQECGAFGHPGAPHTIDSLLRATGILATHRHLVTRWLRHLEADGSLHRDGDSYARSDSPRAHDTLSALWAEADERLRPNRELLAYVKNCAHRLTAIVTGRESALESLFPNGSFELARGLYEGSASMRYINALASAGLEAVARALASGHTLRVLEVGAGTGGTTSSLVPVLPADRTDYLFTDVSDAFLSEARRRFRGAPQVRFGLFDLETEPSDQGYADGQFDIIVSANCVHASRDLRVVLPRLRRLLAPGGLLMLVESTEHFHFHDMTTGLIEGWQAFSDDLRTDIPLLAPDVWTGALHAAGFVEARSWPPRGSVAEALGQHVIVGRAPGAARSTASSTASSARSTAPDPHKFEDQAPASEDLRTRLLAALDAERVTILGDAVRREIMRILRLDASSAPSRSDRLVALGMDSLMAVQLRNVLSEMLKLDRPLPATLIFDHPTIDAISTYLLERSGIRGAAGPVVQASWEGTVASPPVDAVSIARMTDEEIAAALLAREGDNT